MATATRIYGVSKAGAFVSLVRASNPSQAIRHVVANEYEAVVADQDHLVTLIGKGMKVETAKKDEE